MRLPGPRGHRDAFLIGAAQAPHVRRPAWQATEPESSEGRGDVCSLSWSGGRFEVRVE